MAGGGSLRALPEPTFERLGQHLAIIGVACSEAQLLALADRLHDMVRQRRNRRFGQAALAPVELRSWSGPEAR